VQDALDDVALSIAKVDWIYAEFCIMHPQLRVRVGAHYSGGPDDPDFSRSIARTDTDFAGTPAP
jgi:hypothetical protein